MHRKVNSALDEDVASRRNLTTGWCGQRREDDHMGNFGSCWQSSQDIVKPSDVT